ncbi:MAG: alkaline phosphatase family protein [Thermoanaerobaculia bacterium]
MILASFDGLGADGVAQFGAPEFNRLPLHVRRVIPVNPTVTSTTHVAILTGAGPEITGIVANQFHRQGTPRDEITRGLESEISAETLVEAAHRAGKRVGSIAFPTVDWSSPRRSADWGLAFAKPIVAAQIVRLTAADFHEATATHKSYSPAERAHLAARDADIVAYDTTDDGVRNYDQLFVATAGTETPIGQGGWFSITQHDGDVVSGSWSKVLRFDSALTSMTIYLGVTSRNEGYPDSFRRAVDEQIGVWPGQPDENAVRAGEIDNATFVEQLDRLSDFLTSVTRLGLETMPADLVLTYQPIVDETEHQFRSTDAVRRPAYAAFDRAVGRLTNEMRDGDALVVTGDHGVAAVETEVRVNVLLRAAGLAPRWTAFASGNIAQIYRFEEPDDTDRLMKTLRDARAPDGARVFEHIERKRPASHANSGDVTAFAFPRFALGAGNGEAFIRPPYQGQHGALNSHPELHTTLGAIGRGIPAETIPQMSQTRIARFVCELLGINPPRSAE